MTRIIHMLCEATNGYVFWKRGNNDCEFWEELLTPHVRSTSMFSIFDTFSSGGLDFNVILAASGQWKKLRKICDTILKTTTNTLLFMFSFYISFLKSFLKNQFDPNPNMFRIHETFKNRFLLSVHFLTIAIIYFSRWQQYFLSSYNYFHQKCKWKILSVSRRSSIAG